MLSTADALRAHGHCKAKLAAYLSSTGPARDEHDFCPDPKCGVVRFIKESEDTFGGATEIRLLKVAHATVHAVALGLAQKRASGELMDVEFELGAHSNYGAASSSLVAAIWRLEKKLHSMAG